jgi:hypothetical protein
VAEGWARNLRPRHEAAAKALPRPGASDALRRRTFTVTNWLTEEAEAISA